MKKLFALALVLTLLLGCTTAMAAIWPNGTPTVYVGYGAGGGTDTAVRPVVAEMAKYLGENINCVNMPGANSAVGLRSMPVRYLFLDEVDGYPLDVEGEGDAISLAEARTRTFARRKIFIV